ncbi:hypothetical protein ABK040_009040 [Willaertia magna]
MSMVKSNNNTIIINDLNRETIDLSILSNALKQYDEEHHDDLITSSSQHSSFTSITTSTTTADNTSNSSLLSSTSSTHNSSNSNISTNSSNINTNNYNNKITLSPLISPELQTKEERRKSKSFTFFKSKTSSPIKSSNNNKLNEKNISPPSPTTKKGNSNVAAALLLENNKKKRSESNNSNNESNNSTTTTTTTTTSNNNVNIKIPLLNLGNALTSNTTTSNNSNGNGTPKLNLLSINSSRVVGSSDHHTNVSVLATPRGEKQPITKSKSTFFFQRRKSLSSINNSPTGTTINTSINGSNGNNEDVPPPPTNIIPIKQIKKNYLKQQQLDNNSINSNNNNNNIINIDMNILNQLMISNTGYSILQTSMKHVILLIFIKYLGCQQCQKILNDLQFYLSRFLTCNIIPIICHQEDYDKANDYLNNSLDIYSNNTIFGNKEMLNLLHCQVTSDIIENFNLKKEKFSLNQVPNKIKSIFKENKLKKPKEMKIYKLGMFLVEFGNVKKYFIESKNSNKPNILNIILELNKNKEMDKFFPDLLKIYPNLEMFIRKERNSISLSGNYLQNTLQNTSTITIDTLQNNEITLNKVIENIKYRNYFKVFLASEFSSELILFIEQVEMYQMIYRMEEKRKEELNDYFSDLIDSTIIEDFNSNNSNNNTINRNVETERKANYILKHFLTFDAMFQINTNQKRILNIENTIKERGYTFNLFDDVIHDITSTMLKYSFNRFRETDLYKEMLQKINDGTL